MKQIRLLQSDWIIRWKNPAEQRRDKTIDVLKKDIKGQHQVSFGITVTGGSKAPTLKWKSCSDPSNP